MEFSHSAKMLDIPEGLYDRLFSSNTILDSEGDVLKCRVLTSSTSAIREEGVE